MNDYLLVGLGAASGGMARYWLAGIVQKVLPATMPYGTLTVNVIGGFIIGVLMYFFDYNNIISPEVKILLTIGFCGGLTTFSSFSLETFNLLADSEFFYAILNITANVFLSIIATSLGFFLSKLIEVYYGH
jgi:CrcB protein